MYNLTVEDADPHSPTQDTAAQSPKQIVSRSLSRDSKPPSLTLRKTNGKTATAATTFSSKPSSATTSSPGKPSHPAPDRPLPTLPASAPCETATYSRAMGNKASRALKNSGDSDASFTPPNRSLIKRRPVNAPVSRSSPPLPPKDAKRSAGPGNTSNKYSPPSTLDASFASHPISAGAKSTPEPEGNGLPTNNSPQQLPPTPPSEAASGDDSDDRPNTPELKPLVLPSPSPVPEDTPSKYGLGKMKSAVDMRSTLLKNQRSRHFRGKSSTALDIFKVCEAT